MPTPTLSVPPAIEPRLLACQIPARPAGGRRSLVDAGVSATPRRLVRCVPTSPGRLPASKSPLGRL